MSNKLLLVILICFLPISAFCQIPENLLIGKWTTFSAFDISIENAKLSINHSTSVEIIFIFKDDGTGEGTYQLETIGFTWKIVDDKIIVSHSNSEYQALYRVINENLIVMIEIKHDNIDSSVAIFTKNNN